MNGDNVHLVWSLNAVPVYASVAPLVNEVGTVSLGLDGTVVSVGTIEKGMAPEKGMPEVGRVCTCTMLGFTSRWWALTGTPIGLGLLGTTTGLLAGIAAASCTAALLTGAWGSGCAFTVTVGTRCSTGICASCGREGWGWVCICSPSGSTNDGSFSPVSIWDSAALRSTGIGASSTVSCRGALENGCPMTRAAAAAAARAALAAALFRSASGSFPLARLAAWRLTCLLRWSERINRLSQTGQANLFSPV